MGALHLALVVSSIVIATCSSRSAAASSLAQSNRDPYAAGGKEAGGRGARIELKTELASMHHIKGTWYSHSATPSLPSPPAPTAYRTLPLVIMPLVIVPCPTRSLPTTSRCLGLCSCRRSFGLHARLAQQDTHARRALGNLGRAHVRHDGIKFVNSVKDT